MATDSTINIASSGGTITFSAEAEPSDPTISITGTSWTIISGNKLTVSENTGSSDRTTTITVKVTTVEDDWYSGTTAVTSSYTLSQESEIVDGAHANALDIVLESKTNSDIIIVRNKAWSSSKYPRDKWNPIGLVVIPAEHGVLKDGTGTVNQCGIMSLLEMYHLDPSKGTHAISSVEFGSEGVDLSGKADGLGRYDSVTDGLKNYNKIPSGNRNTNTANQLDDPLVVYFPYQKNAGESAEYEFTSTCGPSPYAGEGFNTGPYNEDYGTKRFNTNKDFNALSDFSGIVNTKIITDSVTGQSNWKTASSIQSGELNSGYYPAACCCARFKTKNTKAFVDCTAEELKNGTGFWYLPAIGELGYIIPRAADINKIMETIYRYYTGSSVTSLDRIGYVSSTELNSDYTFSLHLGSGAFGHNMSKNISQACMAFMRL